MPVAGTKMVKVVDYLLDIDSIHDVEEIIRMIKSTPASSVYVLYTCRGNGNQPYRACVRTYSSSSRILVYGTFRNHSMYVYTV